MSCWRSYSCDVLKNVDKDMLKDALKEMGLSIDTKVHRVKSMWDSNAGSVDGVLVKDGRALPLGLVFSDETGHVHVTGDFWGTGLDEVRFTDDLSRIYQKINILTQLELQGYTVDNIETNAEGEIEIEAYCA